MLGVAAEERSGARCRQVVIAIEDPAKDPLVAMLRPGDLVAQRFHIISRAGAGGMGEVFRAHDQRDNRDIALKVLRLASTDETERFVREARVLESLDHPAIVRHVDHGRSEAGVPYLAMEWLEGEDLATRLLRGPLSVGDTIHIGERVAEALAAANAQGVLHRDVKPANVFLGSPPGLDVRVVDFGIARTMLTARALTRTGALVGTPSYMAPEQASSAPVGPEADLFALGCVLYECLSGAPAFGGDTVLAVLAKFVREGTSYAAMRMTYRGKGGWSYPLATGPIATLAKRFVKPIGTDDFFELY